MSDKKILFMYTNIRVAKPDYYSHGLGNIVAVLKQQAYSSSLKYPKRLFFDKKIIHEIKKTVGRLSSIKKKSKIKTV